MSQSAAVRLLDVALGLLFVLSGLVKLSPAVNAGAYDHVSAEFREFAKVFPLSGYFGWRIQPDVYRLGVGGLEAALGFLLIAAPGDVKRLASLVLAAIMVGAAYTLWALERGVASALPAVVCLTLLAARLRLSRPPPPHRATGDAAPPSAHLKDR